MPWLVVLGPSPKRHGKLRATNRNAVVGGAVLEVVVEMMPSSGCMWDQGAAAEICWHTPTSAIKANPSCCPLLPRTTPFPEEKSIPGVINGVLLWADVNAATPLGAWGRSVIAVSYTGISVVYCSRKKLNVLILTAAVNIQHIQSNRCLLRCSTTMAGTTGQLRVLLLLFFSFWCFPFWFSKERLSNQPKVGKKTPECA